MFEIRAAKISDLEEITDIYNSAILKTTATFDTVPKTASEQVGWFKKYGDKYPIFVAESENIVIGWATLSQWSDRCAYSETAEISFYVHENFRGKGVGRRLLEHLNHIAPKIGFHTLISRIAGESDISIHLHETFGFSRIGTMKEVGRKFGKLLDVHLMQKVYLQNVTERTLPSILHSNPSSISWRNSDFADGVWIKDIGKQDGYSIQLVKFEPNAKFPTHVHQGLEFLYILSGKVVSNGKEVSEGETIMAPSGSEHLDFYSISGSIFILFYKE